MQSGTVKVWFEEKGFGFVTLGSGEDCYVHRSHLSDGQALQQGAIVMLHAEWNPQRNKYGASSLIGAVPGPGAKGCGKVLPPAGFAGAPLAGTTSAGGGAAALAGGLAAAAGGTVMA